MTPELGNFALALALTLALILGVLPLWGAHRGTVHWIAMARPLAAGLFAFVLVSFALLVSAFVSNDFSVSYVAAHSNSLLPLPYRVAGAWGGHEGSLLLWLLMLTGWTLAVAVFSRALPDATVARVLAVLGLLAAGFIGFTLFTSNPFARTLPPLPDGEDLNPLLQDAGMIFHPPLLYMGYVGFSVAFAFAMAALIEGRLDAAWAKWSRPWTLAAWVFLTLGILLGSFWAYYELGWGGWWFWDAVENASFMPWLVGTALLHTLAASEKRGTFKNWTVLLAILAFSLSLLGTFLVRSGVLSSVHAFASDPERGMYILVFLVVVIGGSLGLYAWRAPQVGLGGRFSLVSRESMLLLNNVFLLVTTGTVLLGTLYTLALDAFGMGRISVGPPYFEAVFVPLMLPVLLLLSVGPFVAWKNGSLRKAWLALRMVALVSVLVGVAVAVTLKASLALAVGVLLAVWIVLGTLVHAGERLHAGAGRLSLWQRWRAVPLGFWGMVVAHVGVGVFVLGVTLVKGLDHVQDASLKEGGTVFAGGYAFQLRGIEKVKGPNYLAGRARFDVFRQGEHISTLYPEKRFYVIQRMPMTEAAIDRGLTRDLYVSLGDVAPGGAWGVRVQVKPFMGWVWAGCLVMALGGLLAASDRRYRRARHTTEASSSADSSLHASPSTSKVQPHETLPAASGLVPGAGFHAGPGSEATGA